MSAFISFAFSQEEWCSLSNNDSDYNKLQKPMVSTTMPTFPKRGCAFSAWRPGRHVPTRYSLNGSAYGAHLKDLEDIGGNYDGENQILCQSRVEFLAMMMGRNCRALFNESCYEH